MVYNMAQYGLSSVMIWGIPPEFSLMARSRSLGTIPSSSIATEGDDMQQKFMTRYIHTTQIYVLGTSSKWPWTSRYWPGTSFIFFTFCNSLIAMKYDDSSTNTTSPASKKREESRNSPWVAPAVSTRSALQVHKPKEVLYHCVLHGGTNQKFQNRNYGGAILLFYSVAQFRSFSLQQTGIIHFTHTPVNRTVILLSEELGQFFSE